MLEKLEQPQSVALSDNSTRVELSSEKKKCKACCACPETKRARDQCIVENGELNCQSLIDAHKDCMRSMGFKV